MNLLTHIDEKSRTHVVLAGFASILLLGTIDYVTGAELSVSIFYLLPVSVLSWYVGRIAGILGSFFCAVSWLLADVLAGNEYSHQAIPYWNALVRFGFFSIVANTLWSLRRSRDRQEELRQFIIHDLRSPLSNAMTGLQILDEESGPEQRKYVGMAISSCRRMLTLINSLLDLPRLESGVMPLDLSPVPVAAVIDSAIEQVRIWGEQQQVRFSRNIEPTIGHVLADAVATERVLVNLLGNAIKHSPEGSTVTLRVVRIEGSMASFGVTDEGAGVPPEWAEKVFDKYAQLDAQGLHMPAGSGLGLAYCRLAVRAQGGHIWLNSDNGRGTTVVFTLPLVEI